VTAANGGGTLAVVTLTFKQKGKAGLDCAYSVSMADGTGGAVTAAAAHLTGGTTEPSIANVLTLIANREYRFILPCISNADMALASATGTMGRLRTYIAANDTGIGALLQTAHSACTDSTTNAKAMSGQHDFEYFSHHIIRGALSLPCEWAAAIVGVYARESKSDPNHPMGKIEFKAELVGTPAIQSDGLTAAEEEDLLNSGVSYVGYNAQGAPRLERPITTYFEDTDGNPDDRILDVSKVFGMIAVGSYLRTYAQRTFKGKKLLPSMPTGGTPIPPGVIAVEDAKSLILGQIRSVFVTAGVVRGDKLDEAVADGSLVVQVNPANETQLDLFLPLRIVAPLVRTSIYMVQS
jgi:phage tail sheath gpL-like